MCRVSFCFAGATIGRPRTPAAMASPPGGYAIRPCGVGAGHARPGGVWQTGVYGKAAGRTCPAPTSPLKLKLHLFRQVCRGRIYASRAVYPLYRMIVTAAAGGIVAVPTSQPILFILVYGRGRGMPRPYQSIKTKSKALELPRCYSLKPPPARGLFVMPFNSLYNFCRLAAKAKKDFFSLGICVMID